MRRKVELAALFEDRLVLLTPASFGSFDARQSAAQVTPNFEEKLPPEPKKLDFQPFQAVFDEHFCLFVFVSSIIFLTL
jgi:hypothetical protein